jgi:hypothetical protein
MAIPDLANNTSVREAEARLRTLGFTLTEHRLISGDRDWVYAVKVRGRDVKAGEKIPIDLPITLVVGRGTEEDFEAGEDF